MPPPSHDRAEIEQMLSAPSDGYPAGQWCEAANWLLSELERAEAELQSAIEERDMLLAHVARKPPGPMYDA